MDANTRLILTTTKRTVEGDGPHIKMQVVYRSHFIFYASNRVEICSAGKYSSAATGSDTSACAQTMIRQ